MGKKYLTDDSALAGPITPPQSPGSAGSSTLSPELLAKVNDWVNGQQVPFTSETPRKMDYGMKTIFKEPSSDVSSEGKKVHWTPNVQDNEGKTIRKPMASRDDKKIVLSSKTNRRKRMPSAPDPPRSRGPPPAPRPPRLSTPDLPDLKCEEFCDCCHMAPMSKMNAQPAASHIANARQLPRRLN